SRPPGARVDEVVQAVGTQSPGPAPGPTGCRALIAQKHGDASQADWPAVTSGPHSPGEQVAAQIDQAVLAKVVSQAVGQPSLGYSAEVDAGAGAQARPSLLHRKHLRQRWRWLSTSQRCLGWTKPEGARVPDGQHGAQHSGVHQAAAQPVRLQRRVQHSVELCRDLDPVTGSRVEARELAVGLESAEAAVHLDHPCGRPAQASPPEPDAEQMAGAAERFEPGLFERHGSGSQDAYVELTVSTLEVRTAGVSVSSPRAGVETAGGAPRTPGCSGASAFF